MTLTLVSVAALILVSGAFATITSAPALALGTATASLKPTADSSISGVQAITSGVVSLTGLWQQVNDGTSFAGADGDTTRVQTLSGIGGSHTAGYSGAPTGAVSKVVTNVRARRTKLASGTVRVALYDGALLVGNGPTHSLGSAYANFTDTFSNLNVGNANNLRTQVQLVNSAGKGSLMYTEIWADVSYQVADGPPTVKITSPAGGSTVSGTVTVAGTASDDVSVAKVDVQVDGGAFSPVSGTTTWTYPWGTSGMSGSHTLTARATDSAGQTTTATTTVSVGGTAPLALKVSGKNFVDQNGQVVRLLGANRSGTQYACAEGWGIFDGPSDDASIASMKSWGFNAVRVNGNEDCWLGINGVKAVYGGANYQAAVGDFVRRINAQGMYVIFDLHHSAPGATLASGQQPMADRDHSPAYWSSVATYFKNSPAVAFDLYNEPYPDSNRNTTAAWTCVRDGGACPGVPFTAAGSQEMLNAIRSAGATNPVLVGGPQYAGMVDQWLAYQPTDPAAQLAASIHVYFQNPTTPEWSPCYLQACWDNTIGTLAQSVPVFTGEIGEHDCGHTLIDPYLTWADAHGVSYAGWSWFAGNCAAEPALISDYNGTPTAFGIGLRDHLLALPR